MHSPAAKASSCIAELAPEARACASAGESSALEHDTRLENQPPNPAAVAPSPAKPAALASHPSPAPAAPSGASPLWAAESPGAVSDVFDSLSEAGGSAGKAIEWLSAVSP